MDFKNLVEASKEAGIEGVTNDKIMITIIYTQILPMMRLAGLPMTTPDKIFEVMNEFELKALIGIYYEELSVLVSQDIDFFARLIDDPPIIVSEIATKITLVSSLTSYSEFIDYLNKITRVVTGDKPDSTFSNVGLRMKGGELTAEQRAALNAAGENTSRIANILKASPNANVNAWMGEKAFNNTRKAAIRTAIQGKHAVAGPAVLAAPAGPAAPAEAAQINSLFSPSNPTGAIELINRGAAIQILRRFPGGAELVNNDLIVALTQYNQRAVGPVLNLMSRMNASLVTASNGVLDLLLQDGQTLEVNLQSLLQNSSAEAAIIDQTIRDETEKISFLSRLEAGTQFYKNMRTELIKNNGEIIREKFRDLFLSFKPQLAELNDLRLQLARLRDLIKKKEKDLNKDKGLFYGALGRTPWVGRMSDKDKIIYATYLWKLSQLSLSGVLFYKQVGAFNYQGELIRGFLPNFLKRSPVVPRSLVEKRFENLLQCPAGSHQELNMSAVPNYGAVPVTMVEQCTPGQAAVMAEKCGWSINPLSGFSACTKEEVTKAVAASCTMVPQPVAGPAAGAKMVNALEDFVCATNARDGFKWDPINGFIPMTCDKGQTWIQYSENSKGGLGQCVYNEELKYSPAGLQALGSFMGVAEPPKPEACGDTWNFSCVAQNLGRSLRDTALSARYTAGAIISRATDGGVGTLEAVKAVGVMGVSYACPAVGIVLAGVNLGTRVHHEYYTFPEQIKNIVAAFDELGKINELANNLEALIDEMDEQFDRVVLNYFMNKIKDNILPELEAYEIIMTNPKIPAAMKGAHQINLLRMLVPLMNDKKRLEIQARLNGAKAQAANAQAANIFLANRSSSVLSVFSRLGRKSQRVIEESEPSAPSQPIKISKDELFDLFLPYFERQFGEILRTGMGDLVFISGVEGEQLKREQKRVSQETITAALKRNILASTRKEHVGINVNALIREYMGVNMTNVSPTTNGKYFPKNVAVLVSKLSEKVKSGENFEFGDSIILEKVFNNLRSTARVVGQGAVMASAAVSAVGGSAAGSAAAAAQQVAAAGQAAASAAAASALSAAAAAPRAAYNAASGIRQFVAPSELQQAEAAAAAAAADAARAEKIAALRKQQVANEARAKEAREGTNRASAAAARAAAAQAELEGLRRQLAEARAQGQGQPQAATARGQGPAGTTPPAPEGGRRRNRKTRRMLKNKRRGRRSTRRV